MKTSICAGAFAAMLCFLLGQAPVSAQGGAAETQAAPPDPTGASAVPFDLDADQMTAAEVCGYISRHVSKGDGALNIVVANEAANLVLPTMKLHNVTFQDFSDFINEIGGPGQTGKPGSEDGRRFGLSENAGIWYFWAEAISDATASGETMTTVFQLFGDPDASLGLIEEALAATPRDYEPRLKFHEPSSSLIATANKADLDLIAGIVEMGQRSKNLAVATVQHAEIKDLSAKLGEMRRQKEAQLRMTTQEQDFLKKNMDRQLVRLEERLAEARAENQALESMVSKLESKLQNIADSKPAR